jgi:hypothetical protein
LNLASVDVTIHEYLITKTFVLSKLGIIFCFHGKELSKSLPGNLFVAAVVCQKMMKKLFAF